jgi:hypothetical protein
MPRIALATGHSTFGLSWGIGTPTCLAGAASAPLGPGDVGSPDPMSWTANTRASATLSARLSGRTAASLTSRLPCTPAPAKVIQGVSAGFSLFPPGLAPWPERELLADGGSGHCPTQVVSRHLAGYLIDAPVYTIPGSSIPTSRTQPAWTSTSVPVREQERKAPGIRAFPRRTGRSGEGSTDAASSLLS